MMLTNINFYPSFTARTKEDDIYKIARLMVKGESPVARQLRTVLGIKQNEDFYKRGELGAEDIRIRAEGRHDNDLPDFRSIKILPTISEITCELLPYLPQNNVTDEAEALERQFRLLREDMVGPARRELLLLRKGGGNLENLFHGVAIEEVNIPEGKTPPYFTVSFDLNPDHKALNYTKHKDRKKYWETSSKGKFPTYRKPKWLGLL